MTFSLYHKNKNLFVSKTYIFKIINIDLSVTLQNFIKIKITKTKS